MLVIVGSWLPVVAIVTALLAVRYWFSDRIALSSMQAELVGPEEEPRLYALLTRLCAQADIPKPALAVADTGAPNAFAAGRNPAHAVLCVTAGLTEQLADDELEAILARELSRLTHRDAIVLNTAPLIATLAAIATRIPFHTAPFGSIGWQTNPALGARLIAVALSVYALGFLLTQSVARHRELAADRAGALLTGQPSPLARALIKLDTANTAIPTRDLRTPATRRPPPVIGSASRRSRGLLSTHPNLTTRLDQLVNLATAPERSQ